MLYLATPAAAGQVWKARRFTLVGETFPPWSDQRYILRGRETTGSVK